MTPLELWTRVAIVVLVAGSIVVFAWFARDLLRLERRWRTDGAPSDETPRPERDRGEDPPGEGVGNR